MPGITPSARIRNPRNGVPKGSVTKYELEAGTFYPGTPHKYSIYVPAHTMLQNPRPS